MIRLDARGRESQLHVIHVEDAKQNVTVLVLLVQYAPQWILNAHIQALQGLHERLATPMS